MLTTETGLGVKQLLSVQQAKGRVSIWEGSVRSGKTIASLLRWAIDVATSDIQGELVVVSRTRDSAARNVFSPLQSPDIFGPLANQVEYTPGAPTATMLGRKVWVMGSSDIRSEHILRGLTCAGAYVDEVTLLREDFFVQLLNRLWEGARLFGTTNPDNPAHWLKANYLDRLEELPDWRTWHFLLDDNPALTEERKDAIKRENTGLFYRRNVEGEWVAAEGAVFDSWDPDKHVVKESDLPTMHMLVALGIDYGVRNATAAILVGVGTDGRLYAVDEWRRARRNNQGTDGLTIAEVSTSLSEWLGERKPRFIPVDPSAAELKLQLHRDKLSGVMDADHEVVYGIRTMASLLASGRLRVCETCPGLIEEMPAYSWDDKAAERGEDKPLKTADHSIDSFRYALISTETIWRRYLDQTPTLADAA